MQQDNIQELYINIDDSGKLSNKEKISVYGGILFFSKNEKDRFITQYREIISDIKCKYCIMNKIECNNNCPEIKNYIIRSSDKRRIMNYLKKYFVVAAVINNNKVYKHIIYDKASKGRFIDYVLRRLIKSVIIELINKKIIDPYNPLKIIINIDEQSTKSNGYYNLKDGLVEELLHGICNFDYRTIFNPIVFSKLDIKLNYQNSGKSYVVQAADFLAGTIRKIYVIEKDIDKKIGNLVNIKIIFP